VEPFKVTPVSELDEDLRTSGGTGDVDEGNDVIELADVFRVSGGGGPTNARGRTDLGGFAAEGINCFNLSNSSIIGGGEELGSGGDSEGEGI
jgi:hypothetical protein